MTPISLQKEFPILDRKIHGKRLVFLDSAVSSQKPKAVIDAISTFTSKHYSNVHRGLYTLSHEATVEFEKVRERIQLWIKAKSSNEIVFVRGVTEGINLVAHSFGKKYLKPGDEILTTQMEHHSNIVPWHLACQERGATLQYVHVTPKGELDLDDFKKKLSSKTKLVAFAHISNALGTLNPVKHLTQLAQAKGARVLIDGAQAAPHLPIDVQDIGCDFYVFSSHKMYGPTGVGVLYGKLDELNALPPYQGGGEMIETVSIEDGITYKDAPARFEAGTPDIMGVVGLGAAISFLERFPKGFIETYEKNLHAYAFAALQDIPGLKLLCQAKEKAAVLTFVMDGIHPQDLATLLDKEGIAVRAGHHCAMPLMGVYGVSASTRASIAIYNTHEDIDILVEGIKKAQKILS